MTPSRLLATTARPAAGVVLLLSLKPHQTAAAGDRPGRRRTHRRRRGVPVHRGSHAGTPAPSPASPINTRTAPSRCAATLDDGQDHRGQGAPGRRPERPRTSRSPPTPSAADPGGAERAERAHRRRLRRHLHQRGLHPVPAERPGQGRCLSARRAAAPRRARHGHRLLLRHPRPAAPPPSAGPWRRPCAWLHRVDEVFSTYRPDSADQPPRPRRARLADVPARGGRGARPVRAGGARHRRLVQRTPRRPARPVRAGQGLGHRTGLADAVRRRRAPHLRQRRRRPPDSAARPPPAAPWRIGIAHPPAPGSCAPSSPDAIWPSPPRAPPNAAPTSRPAHRRARHRPGLPHRLSAPASPRPTPTPRRPSPWAPGPAPGPRRWTGTRRWASPRRARSGTLRLPRGRGVTGGARHMSRARPMTECARGGRSGKSRLCTRIATCPRPESTQAIRGR